MQETPEHVYQESRRRKNEIMPALLQEMDRITRLTGFNLEPQSSFFVGINLPGDTSDLDIAIVGLHTQQDFDRALAIVKSAKLNETIKETTVSARPGFLVRYVSPAGFPVDLQIRRQREIDIMKPCWLKLSSASESVKMAIVWNKWLRKDDERAYKAYKLMIYSWAGFPTNWNEVV